MSLSLVAIPLGNPDDITLRGLQFLRDCDAVILEETKEGTRFLRHHGISGKQYELLNEHTTSDDLSALVSLCTEKNVALISDCGTPNFCDPGADLIRECRARGIAVRTLPGASSLMALLSLTSLRLREFVFRGFLPAETEERGREWAVLARERRAIVVMDTPYRLEKTLVDLETHFGRRRILLVGDVTQETEFILEGLPSEVHSRVPIKKAEFLVLIYPA